MYSKRVPVEEFHMAQYIRSTRIQKWMNNAYVAFHIVLRSGDTNAFAVDTYGIDQVLFYLLERYEFWRAQHNEGKICMS